VAAVDFRARYGRWAVIAGASEGIGAAFAYSLAARGLDVVLVARRRGPLDALAASLTAQHRIATRVVALDLAEADSAERLGAATDDLDVGLLICNAALVSMTSFFDTSVDVLARTLDLNCRAPMLLTRRYGAKMRDRGRGGIVMVSSLAALLSNPHGAAYGATKAFECILAEGIGGEQSVVDMVTCLAGPTRTPGLSRQGGDDMQSLSAEQVVEETLRGLGRQPRVIPGRLNRAAAWFMTRLPRKWAIGLVASQTKKLKPEPLTVEN